MRRRRIFIYAPAQLKFIDSYIRGSVHRECMPASYGGYQPHKLISCSRFQALIIRSTQLVARYNGSRSSKIMETTLSIEISPRVLNKFRTLRKAEKLICAPNLTYPNLQSRRMRRYLWEASRKRSEGSSFETLPRFYSFRFFFFHFYFFRSVCRVTSPITNRSNRKAKGMLQCRDTGMRY